MIYDTLGLGVGMIVSAFIGLLVAIILVKAFAPSRSRNYRQYLTNLLVAGKVRQLAEKEKVNLIEEEKLFLIYEKLSTKRRLRDLDNKIEEELMQKIEKDLEEAKAKEK